MKWTEFGEEFSGGWLPWSLGGPWGQYFLQCSFPDVEKVKRAAFHVDTITSLSWIDKSVKLWTTLCGDIGKEDYLLTKKGQFCLYKERKNSAGGIYCPFVVSQVCPTMGSCFKMKRRLLFCGSWGADVYIGTTFVKKYPMSNSVEIYRSLFQALTKSFLTLGCHTK